jgi:hypothetical protein
MLVEEKCTLTMSNMQKIQKRLNNCIIIVAGTGKGFSTGRFPDMGPIQVIQQ